MKRTITISYATKRTFNLGNYENLVPTNSINETIELNDGENFSNEDYQKEFARIKGLLREQISEDAMRIKGQDMSYVTEVDLYVIGKLIKEKKLTTEQVNAILAEWGFPSVYALTSKSSEKLINYLKNYDTSTNSTS